MVSAIQFIEAQTRQPGIASRFIVVQNYEYIELEEKTLNCIRTYCQRITWTNV